jgi:hypothetical protein
MTNRAVEDAETVQASELPPLIRAYAERALLDPLKPGRTLRVQQVGEMLLKPDAAPRRFSAIEDFAIDRVAFAWRAWFPIVGPIGFRVTDSYDGRDGLLDVRLTGLSIQRDHGAWLARGEAYRYLAEIAWIPHAILANRELEYNEIDARTVEVATRVGGARIAVGLVFNERGEIEQTVADRPRLEADGAVTPWIGVYRDYRDLCGVRVPTRGEVRWEPADGPFTYWHGRITALELREEPLRAPTTNRAKTWQRQANRPRAR